MPNKHPSHDRAIVICRTYFAIRNMMSQQIKLDAR